VQAICFLKCEIVTLENILEQLPFCKSTSVWVLGLYGTHTFVLPIPVAARSKRGSAAARLLGLPVRIPPGASTSVSCDCCVMSGSGLCEGPITRPEKSYRVSCGWVWSRSLDNEEALAHQGLSSRGKKIVLHQRAVSCFGALFHERVCGATNRSAT
jgi:hypothetical protein